MENTTNTVKDTNITSTDDISELLEDCTELLKPMLKAVKSHYYEYKLKSSCQLSVEFSENRDEELIIKIIPKKTLPIETVERTGEFTSKGELQLI